MHVIYDVSHNIAKVEEHIVDGKQKTLLVHRKVCTYNIEKKKEKKNLDVFESFCCHFWQGSTRAFPPHHPLIPVDYQLTGQPVLIGGTMGTCSYVLTGTERGMQETFGSTCHGAVSSLIFQICCLLPWKVSKALSLFDAGTCVVQGQVAAQFRVH